MPGLVTESSWPTVTFINRACNELKVVIFTQSKFKFVQTGFQGSSGVVWFSHSNKLFYRIIYSGQGLGASLGRVMRPTWAAESKG